MQTINYINLTNGIESIPSVEEHRFIRIQSTACEQKRWDFIIQDLDNDFLMNLAVGNRCVVHDYGANKPVSRALYQGLIFIRFCIELCWFGEVLSEPNVKGNNCTKYFHGLYCNLENRTLLKLKYFRKFLITDNIHLDIQCATTNHDGDIEFYKSILILTQS